METIKFSIVIPVYNAEKYIKQCIESIINQHYKHWELILVDDGSTDESYTICMQESENDNRITVLHKENGGASSARNVGIKNSTGNYLVFVDADDLVAPFWLYGYYKCIAIFHPDICFNDFSLVPSNYISLNYEDTTIKNNWKFHQFYAKDIEELFKYKWINFSATWSKCFKTTIISNNDILFANDLNLYEDFLFTTECICNSTIFASVNNNKGYLYRCVDGSLSRKYIKDLSSIINRVEEYLYRLKKAQNFPQCYKLFLKNTIQQYSFIQLPIKNQIILLIKARRYKLNIPYKRFIIFNKLIRTNININIIRLYIVCINKIRYKWIKRKSIF